MNGAPDTVEQAREAHNRIAPACAAAILTQIDDRTTRIMAVATVAAAVVLKSYSTPALRQAAVEALSEEITIRLGEMEAKGKPL